MGLYDKTLRALLSKNLIGLDDKILVTCGGPQDRDIFLANGFKDVIISNLDYHDDDSNFEPYKWERQDAEELTHDDSTFDWVFAHFGLHHCASPHKALCEMLRVAIAGVVVFESRDSLLMRAAVFVGIVPEYELAPVALTEGERGGYRNSSIPNYVYRWTERAVESTVKSYLPQFTHTFLYFYGYRVPTQRLAMSRRMSERFLARLFKIAVPIVEKLFPRQGNEFGFLVTKRELLQPWIKEVDDNLVPDLNYLKENFNVEKYKKT